MTAAVDTLIADLPGFGSPAKLARAPYDAAWFASAVRGYMDALGIERAHLVVNSMGGRMALEFALSAPERVEALSLLAPALASAVPLASPAQAAGGTRAARGPAQT